jgi:hypothetical protein
LVQIKSTNRARDVELSKENPAMFAPMTAGFSCGGVYQLAKKTRNRDHDACDPRSQAGKQQKVGDKRHATASPFASLCSTILTGQKISLRRMSDLLRKSFAHVALPRTRTKVR